MNKPRISDALRRDLESRTGILSGFPSPGELLRLFHIVKLEGLAPAALGYQRFRSVLGQCVAAAVRIAPLEFRHIATYAGGERIGYEFRFLTAMAAVRFRLAYDAAMQGKPCPTMQVQS